MSKRIAGDQIRVDANKNPILEESDDDIPSSKASQNVLSSRKIIKPRGRFQLSQSTSVPFNNTPSSFGSGIRDDRNEKLKALNDKVIETLISLNKPNEIANFKPIFDKYNKYYLSIESDNSHSSVSQDNTSKGSLFSIKDSNDKPSFLFGNNQSDNTNNSTAFSNDKTSSFLANAQNKVEVQTSDPVEVPKFPDFKSTEEPSKPSISFNSKPSKDTITSNSLFGSQNSGKPAFSLGTLTTANNAAFSFPPLTDKVAPLSDNKENDKPAFSFGTVQSTKPVFLFGSKDSENSVTPAFSFGNNGKSDETKKQGFSLGNNSSNVVEKEKPAISFGASNDNSQSGKPTFSFNKPSESNNSTAPNFSFTNKDESKGLGKETPTFGNKPNSGESVKPAFTFKKLDDANNGTDKPLFPFAQSDSNKSAINPVFSFGDNSNSAKSAISFGDSKPVQSPFSSGNNLNKSTFSFVKKDTEPLFSFSQSTSNPDNKDDTNDKVEEEEVVGDFKPIASLNSTETNEKTGEEDEIVQYTKRTKLMLFQPSNSSNSSQAYLTKGVGELKILTNKETNKSRLLIRADGGLRILLNSSIQSDFEYTLLGDGLVRFPLVLEGKIQTYVLKVKTKSDGEELMNNINKFK